MKSESWSVGRFPSFFRLHSPLNKADPLWNRRHCSYRSCMGGNGWGGNPQQSQIIIIRTFRSSALSQQPTQTSQKITNSWSAQTLFTEIFILSIRASHKAYSNGENYTGHLLRPALVLPLSEDQGLKSQISCTATKTQEVYFCASHSSENCSKFTHLKERQNLFASDQTIPKLQLFPRLKNHTYWRHYKISDESSEKLVNIEFQERSSKFGKRRVFREADYRKSRSQPDQIWQTKNKFICSSCSLVFRNYLSWRLLGKAHTQRTDGAQLWRVCAHPTLQTQEVSLRRLSCAWSTRQLWSRFVQYKRAISHWAWRASSNTAFLQVPSLAQAC